MKFSLAFGGFAIAVLSALVQPAWSDDVQQLKACVDFAINGGPVHPLKGIRVAGHTFNCHQIGVMTEAQAKAAGTASGTYSDKNAFYQGQLSHHLARRPDDQVQYAIILMNWAKDCVIRPPDVKINRGGFFKIASKVPFVMDDVKKYETDWRFVAKKLEGNWEATAQLIIMASVDKWAAGHPECKKSW